MTLIECAKHLARLRQTAPPEARPLISNLIEQLKNYPSNPGALRPRILKSAERVRAARLNFIG